VQFTAIVNIFNGPGDGALPNAEYSDAIEHLNSFNNIRTIGYVATTWCAKNLSTVLDEVAAYSYWGDYDASLAMSGIFVDETPTQYSAQYSSYLRSITQAVKESSGLKDSFVGKAYFSSRHSSHTYPHDRLEPQKALVAGNPQ
jgi:hypothetical protein